MHLAHPWHSACLARGRMGQESQRMTFWDPFRSHHVCLSVVLVYQDFCTFLAQPRPQCSILLVTRVVFNFITERGEKRENLFLQQVYMLAVTRVFTLYHQMFYKIFRILCNCLLSKRKNQISSTFY